MFMNKANKIIIATNKLQPTWFFSSSAKNTKKYDHFKNKNTKIIKS